MNTPAFLEINVDRVIKAKPEKLFRAWTELELMKQWFGALQLSMDPRVGGLLFIEVDFEDRLWPHFGRYLKVDPPHHITFTWMSESTLGRETTVELELTPVGDSQTQMRLIHTGVPDVEAAQGHEEGWTECLAELARFAE